MFYEVEKLDPVVRKHHISLVLLFGSRAKGNNSPESDLDLGVLFECDAFDRSEVVTDLFSVFPDYHLDLAILNHADPVLKFEIISNYRILYCADPEVFINFYTNTIKQYNDIQKFLKQEELYLNNYLGGPPLEYGNVIRRKLVRLTEFTKELKPLADYTYEQYVENYFIKRTGERLIQLIVENMVDINSIIISKKNLPPPKDYYSSFELLGSANVLPPDFAVNLAPSTGMRNRLVHEYDQIDDQIIFDSIPKLLSMVDQYIAYIYEFLKIIDK